MRNTFTFFLLLITGNLFAQYKQAGLSQVRTNNSFSAFTFKNQAEHLCNRVPGTPLKVMPKKGTAVFSISHGCSPSPIQHEIILVVDGVIVDMSSLEKMDSNTIESVDVLTENESTAIFGCRRKAVVVIITTKGQACRTILIRDFLDGTFIPGATVCLISYDRKDTLMYMADTAGQVRTDELKRNKGWSVTVSSSGYRSYTGQLSYSNKQEILLERDVKTGPEAIVASGHMRRIACSFGHYLADSFSVAENPITAREINIFPNPVKRGQPLNVRLTKGVFPDGLLKVLSSDGRLLMSVPVGTGKNQGLLQFSTDQRWAAGIYLLQLVYANGRVGASEKIIIQ